MRRATAVFGVVVAGAVAAGCAGSINSPGDSAGDDDVVDEPDEPIDPQDPDYESDHPRIYLPRNRDRLVAALAGSSAEHFRYIVDVQLGGTEIYDFKAWYA